MISSVLVATGGFFGAISRAAASKKINQYNKRELPLGTLLVNLAGSFLLGILIGININHSLFLLFGTGFLGAFTTFSTFKLENIQLHIKKKWKTFFLYIGLSYSLGILLVFAGLRIGYSL
ncbi:fluoride efflux transporter CrcB [Fictibacillus sp. UD]|uniref:fluoride efflux transporter CrcB n=1 Tax=Fictibacillus sp. UD TaxID=3038777 RepID=UPI00374532B2